jgi:hypothetical protein
MFAELAKGSSIMEINKTTTVNQSLDKVWEIMATDFTKVANWTSVVQASRNDDEITTRLEGAPVGGRVCTLPSSGEIEEAITHFDEREKYFRYQVDVSAMPPFVKNMANNLRFRSLGSEQTEVNTKYEIDLDASQDTSMAPMFIEQVSKSIDIVLEELKYYAETGNLHPRKVEALEEARQAVPA